MNRANSNKNVLMPSYDFPPMGTPGALRAAKFARYLPKYGWNPYVVTCKLGSSATLGLEDHEHLEDVQIVRSLDWKRVLKKARPVANPISQPQENHHPAWYRRLLAFAVGKAMFPDRGITWYPSAVREASRIARHICVDVVYSSSPNISNHLVAGKIAKRYQVPWVAEFRDLWAIDSESVLDKWTQMRCKRSELAIVRQANRIVVVTENQKSAMLKAYPELASKIVVIRNGFDPADVKNIETSPPATRLVLTHCGSLYGGERKTGPLLQALANLKEQGLLSQNCFQLDFVGPAEQHLVNQIDNLDLSSVVKCVGKVSYQESLRRIAKSSAVLIIVHTSRIGISAVPTKFYDSLAVRRPMLALVKKGYETEELVSSLDVGKVIDPDDSGAIEKWIAKELLRISHGEHLQGLDPNVANKYSREQRTADLAEVFNGICE